MKNIICLFLIVQAQSAFCGEDAQSNPEVKEITSGLPDDLKSFVERLFECAHWANEPQYDNERAEFIRRAAEKAGCSSVEDDEKSLRLKYKENKKFIDSIDKSNAIVYGTWDSSS